MTNVSKAMEYAATFEREAMREKLDAALGDLDHMNLIQLEAMVLHHAQQIKDIAKHLLELQRYMEFKREPVAWGVFEGNLHDMFFTEAEAVQMADLKGTHAEVKPLYTAPPQRTEQEPDDIASILACRNMLDAQPVPPRENT